MAADQTDKRQTPEFGPNGAVLNAPTMSDDLRADYLGLKKTTPVKQDSPSAVARLISLCLLMLFAYVMGMKYPITTDASTIRKLVHLSIVLMFLGTTIDPIINKIKKLAARSNR